MSDEEFSRAVPPSGEKYPRGYVADNEIRFCIPAFEKNISNSNVEITAAYIAAGCASQEDLDSGMA